MNKLFRRAKNRFVRWLGDELELVKANERRASCARMSEGVVLAPEALIENCRNDPEYVRIGQHSYVRGHLFIYGHGGKISIGEWSYVGMRSEIWSMNSISIGDRVLIAHDVNIHDGTAHSRDPLERHQHFKAILTNGHPSTQQELPGVASAPIIIEDDVWVSFGVTILRGVRIGKGSVIAANSTVTRDVPPGSLYRCSITPMMSPALGGQAIGVS